ncbi:hypothetical protein HUJ05_006305 [Dendroctonus ponderosae]|nr:hypothetical protein HUJ05_006305 [Dendroctonus ponderosae]
MCLVEVSGAPHKSSGGQISAAAVGRKASRCHRLKRVRYRVGGAPTCERDSPNDLATSFLRECVDSGQRNRSFCACFTSSSRSNTTRPVCRLITRQ